MTKQVSIEDFIRIWLSAETLQDVSEATGLLKTSCSIRAKKLRALGAELPPFKRGPPRKLAAWIKHGSRS